MCLIRVVYELFESDACSLDRQADTSWHVIDREIRLDFDGRRRFITWMTGPEKRRDWFNHTIGLFDRPQFCRPAPVRRDMSGSSIWQPLIGREIRMAYLDKDHQILRVSSGPHAVYCCSMNEEGCLDFDCVHVSATLPVIKDESLRILRWEVK